MFSFITGSRHYGSETEESDVDLVIFCDNGTEARLKELSDDKKFPIRFGKLNVITLKTIEEFVAWKVARDRITPTMPKSDRVDEHKRVLDALGCKERNGVSGND